MNKTYQPIEKYGVIGDLNTVALISMAGHIDFMCFPNFDSPTIFGALLDKDKGGYYSITPIFEDFRNKQMYLPDTNILLTRFLSVEGVSEILDFMPVEELFSGNVLVRKVKSVRGTIRYRLRCCPRFDYSLSPHEARKDDNTVLFHSSVNGSPITLRLRSNVVLEIEDNDAYAEFTLNEGEAADFVLELLSERSKQDYQISVLVDQWLKETTNFWKSWIERSNYKGRWLEMVNRSALLLKLLTSSKYGSIVAAPTFGLPEQIGGGRNWDYRYTWIRDASFTLYALINLGYTREARAFMNWVHQRCEDIGKAGYLGLLYALDGRKELTERTLDHWEGYKRSSPVRIGNAAYNQFQLDIYGELMDSIYLYDKFGDPISHDFWKDISAQIDWLCANWQRPDEGIWEVRAGKKEFLYSRLMCWVGLDRAIKLETRRSFPVHAHWVKERDKIYNSIYEEFWNGKLKAFVQYKGSETLDASALLMPLMRFISAEDPRWLSTMAAMEKELISDSLVYRYRTPDGLAGSEGTFSMCSFWYVECLSKSGQLQKARYYFEKMLGYANHLGLYSEQLGFEGEHLGNYPQAFTHLGLISAALNLNNQLNNERNKSTEF